MEEEEHNLNLEELILEKEGKKEGKLWSTQGRSKVKGLLNMHKILLKKQKENKNWESDCIKKKTLTRFKKINDCESN